MKFVVVCYSVYNCEIASHDWFDNYEDAALFLAEDAANTYSEEIANTSEDDAFIEVRDGFASVWNGEYQWTWEIIKEH